MRLTTANPTVIALKSPATQTECQFNHPRDVVSDPSLTKAEKRAILASWASDAVAIPSNPTLRAPQGLKAPVAVDVILHALRSLDDDPWHPPGGKPARLRSTLRALAA